MAGRSLDIWARAWHNSSSRRTALRLMAGSSLGAVAMPAAARKEKISFAATFTGTFEVTGGEADSPLFVVEESGTGAEETLGDFTYVASVRQNEARAPKGCGPGSSTGVSGSSVVTFADGELRLRRTAGTACFAFPIVTIAERWKAVSGTGRFVGATGKLTREGSGNVISGAIPGTLSGAITMR